MCHTSFSLIFQIKTNLISCFFTILHKFSKCCFPIPFSALNSSTHFNTPKLRLPSKNIPFFAKDVDAAVCLKNYPFLRFLCTRVRSQSCGEWTPRVWTEPSYLSCNSVWDWVTIGTNKIPVGSLVTQNLKMALIPTKQSRTGAKSQVNKLQ